LPLRERLQRLRPAGRAVARHAQLLPVEAGAERLTILLAQALRAERIAMNSMCPGWVRTTMGGPNADRSVEEGADTAVWLADEAPQELKDLAFSERGPAVAITPSFSGWGSLVQAQKRVFLIARIRSAIMRKFRVRPVNGVLDEDGEMPSERRALPCPQGNRGIGGRNRSGGSGSSVGSGAA
jgi:hypothetical protein